MPGTQQKKGKKRYLIQGPRTSKTIPYSEACTYIAHIWQYPDPQGIAALIYKKAHNFEGKCLLKKKPLLEGGH